VAKELGASDLYITSGLKPMIRLHGNLLDLPADPPGFEDSRKLLLAILSKEQVDEYYAKKYVDFSLELDGIGRNITGIERLINARLGLTEKDDTLPDRWFEEEITAGPFAGEKIDRGAFEALKIRYYDLLGLNAAGVPSLEWHRRLAEATTGFAVKVALPEGIPGAPEGAVIVDQPVPGMAGIASAEGKEFLSM